MFWGDIFGEGPRREPITQSLRTKLLLRCKGKCELCGLDFHEEGVKPHFHHKDGDPSNNRPSNLIVVCPNCHSKLHKKRGKPAAIKPKKEKKSKKSKTKKSKRKKRRREPESPWGFDLLGNITF
ncbi:MAG: HNH endonuclease signature motif containing protein [Candidatus Bathyarchaeia archaeon]